MLQPRWILLLGNVTILVATGFCLWLPIHMTDIPERTLQRSGVSPPAYHPREIAAPDLDRSLFQAASHDAPAPETQDLSSAPEMRLAGVLISDNLHIALIELQDASLQRVIEGDEVDGWIVTSIQPRSITLTGQDRVKVYPLDASVEEQ